MSFLRNLKRKKTSAERKEQRKQIQTAKKEALESKMNEALLLKVSKKRNKYSVGLADNNFQRLSDYVQSYYWPQFIRVLRTDFGFGYSRIVKLDSDVTYYLELISDPRFITKEWILEDFEKIGFDFKEREMEDVSLGMKTGDYVVIHCQNIARKILNLLELVWYATLNYRTGFGRERLEKVRNAFRKAEKKHIGRRALWDAMKKMEKECFIVRDGERDNIDFSHERKTLDILTNKDSKLSFVVKGDSF